jgi:hypothetical protein
MPPILDASLSTLPGLIVIYVETCYMSRFPTRRWQAILAYLIVMLSGAFSTYRVFC